MRLIPTNAESLWYCAQYDDWGIRYKNNTGYCSGLRRFPENGYWKWHEEDVALRDYIQIPFLYLKLRGSK